ncbi:ribonuclease P [Artemisia annua]|uniref:Ribonuclease P n=1 Tax=Artemisia annua TaxID=35608 RepID=A0A2U1LNJ1_ARTAN|nr:ribonuclease P [Artemisia annua]
MSHCYDSGYDSDAYDSDECPEEMKNNKWYFVFFTTLDKHTVEEINDPERLWRCPACQNGTGAIRKFKGLKSLVDHAKKILNSVDKIWDEVTSLISLTLLEEEEAMFHK